MQASDERNKSGGSVAGPPSVTVSNPKTYAIYPKQPLSESKNAGGNPKDGELVKLDSK